MDEMIFLTLAHYFDNRVNQNNQSFFHSFIAQLVLYSLSQL